MVETPYRAGGANIFQLAVNDYPTPRISNHGEIDALLDKCLTLKVGVVRAHTLGSSVGANAFSLVTGVSGTGTTPSISYNDFVWETIDYAVTGAAQRGLYLAVPMVDEHGYYHGGKRTWVNFRRPGTCSTNPSVNSANSTAQRAAENYFYTDVQIKRDFKQYLKDWLNHTNRYTGRALKDEPAVGLVETGNELWTSTSYPSWNPEIAQHIKAIAPNTLVADGSAADGQTLVPEHLASPYLDVFGTHPYTTFGAETVRTLARQAAQSKKAFWVGEYGWSKTNAAAIERVVREEANIFTSAFWSLQNDSDLHNGGGPDKYGSDNASFYVPGKTQIERDANTRLINHGAILAGQSVVDPGARPNAYEDTWKDVY